MGGAVLRLSREESRKLNDFYDAMGVAHAGPVDDGLEELRRFKLLSPNRFCDPLEEWGLRLETQFPVLAELAKVFLAIPASNAAVERLFSDASNVYSTKRKSLDPETACAIIFLYSNRNLFWPK